MSAGDNTQNLETSVQIATAKTVFTTLNISTVLFELTVHK